MESPLIHDRGRGPELVGTRITVYNLIPYFLNPETTETQIACGAGITPGQVAAMRAYVLRHYAEVMAVHQQIEERIRRGIEAQNTPEFQTRRARVAEEMQLYRVWLRERDPSAVPTDPAERAQAFREWLASRRRVPAAGGT